MGGAKEELSEGESVFHRSDYPFSHLAGSQHEAGMQDVLLLLASHSMPVFRSILGTAILVHPANLWISHLVFFFCMWQTVPGCNCFRNCLSTLVRDRLGLLHSPTLHVLHSFLWKEFLRYTDNEMPNITHLLCLYFGLEHCSVHIRCAVHTSPAICLILSLNFPGLQIVYAVDFYMYSDKAEWPQVLHLPFLGPSLQYFFFLLSRGLVQFQMS